MFNLDSTDVLEAIASVDAKIKFTVSCHDATDGVVSNQGYVGNGNTEIYTATGATRVYSFTAHNTHTSAVTLTLNKDPANAGTLWSFFSISLGIGYDLTFDGVSLTIRDASGNILYSVVPATVPMGGTGLTTITDHSVMVGSGAGNVTPITVGATSQILKGVTGADPAFGDDLSMQMDATPGRVMRAIYVGITDGTNASTLNCLTQSEFNGDTVAAVDNIAKDATTGGFSLSVDGKVLTIEASLLTGNVVFATGFVYVNSTGTVLDAQIQPGSNDIIIRMNHASTGVLQDLTALVDSGYIYSKVMYFTDA